LLRGSILRGVDFARFLRPAICVVDAIVVVLFLRSSWHASTRVAGEFGLRLLETDEI
jgi:hypothetical protein